MSDFLNYADRRYKFDNDGINCEGHPKEKTLVVDGCSMVQAYDDLRIEGGDIGIYFCLATVCES
mgnify:CR=1 FL=1